MRFMAVLLLFLILSPPAHPAFERQPAGGMPAAMGGAGVASMTGVWSALLNPATLGPETRRSISVSWAPRPFDMAELARGDLLIVEPFLPVTVALHASRFGFEAYREITFGGSCAFLLTGGVSAGLGLHWYALSIEGYGSAGCAGIDAGLLVRFDDDVGWGTSASNLNAPSIGEANERLPQVFSTGVSYRPLDAFTACLDLVKDTRFPLELRFGLDLTPHPVLHLRAGAATEPSTYAAGVGLRYLGFGFDYAWTTHADLGATHEFSLIILPDDF